MVNASAIKTDTKQYLKEKFNGLSKEEFINMIKQETLKKPERMVRTRQTK